MNDSIPEPADESGPATDESGWYYYTRVRWEFLPLMSAGEHTKFGEIIDRNVEPGEFDQWLDEATEELNPCEVDDCFAMTELCDKCGCGHCLRHPHID